MVALLAKDGAVRARRSARERTFLLGREKQLRELARFMGQLTFAANNYSRSDGVVLRDSTAVKSFRKRRPKQSSPKKVVPAKAEETAKLVSKQKCRPLRSRFVFYGLSRPSHMSCVGKLNTRRFVERRSMGIEWERRDEASFMEWWRESRSHSLKPRDLALPTAQQRTQDLLQRLRSRGMG